MAFVCTQNILQYLILSVIYIGRDLCFTLWLDYAGMSTMRCRFPNPLLTLLRSTFWGIINYNKLTYKSSLCGDYGKVPSNHSYISG